MKRMMLLLAVLMLAIGVQAQAGTRPVSLSWTESSAVTGYNVYRCVAPCTPTTALTPLNGTTLVTTTVYADAPTTGFSYVYGVTAVAPACSSSSSASGVCGTSAMGVSGTVPVPLTPGAPGTIIIVVP